MLISPAVRVLGNGLFNLYLVGGEDKVLLECGVSGIIPRLAGQVRAMGATGGVSRLVVMHAHFDHVCGLPGLRGLFPQARTAGSARAAEVLARETVVENFFREDRAMQETLADPAYGGETPPAGFRPPRTLSIEEIIRDNTVLTLGAGVSLVFYAAPGHSPCSLMAYSPGDGVLFSSDSAGFPVHENMIFPIFFQSYALYVQTIKRMLEFSAGVLAAAHGDVVSGPARVRSYLAAALDWAEKTRQLVVDALRRGDDREEVARRIFDLFYRDRLKIYTPENIMLCCQLIVKRAAGV